MANELYILMLLFSSGNKSNVWYKRFVLLKCMFYFLYTETKMVKDKLYKLHGLFKNLNEIELTILRLDF